MFMAEQLTSNILWKKLNIPESTFYNSMFLYHIYVVLYRILFPMTIETQQHYGGDWVYLTHWNSVIQITYYIANRLVITFLKSDYLIKLYNRLKHIAFACIIFPLGNFVSIMFWTLYLISPSLVIDSSVIYNETPWFNHMKHSFVCIWVTFELLIVNHKYPSSLLGFYIAFLSPALYLISVFAIHNLHGFWVYPILGYLTIPLRIVFCTAIILLYEMLYLFGRWANNKLHKTNFVDIVRYTLWFFQKTDIQYKETGFTMLFRIRGNCMLSWCRC